MSQDQGASAKADRAATPSEPSQSSVVSGVAGIPCAFTPGPWAIFPYVQTPGKFTIIDASRQKLRVAIVDDGYDGVSRADAHANAHLIAVAPELYDVLDTICDLLRTGETFAAKQVAASRGMPVLAKARGQ